MSSTAESLPPPPPYCTRTFYDETLLSKFYAKPFIGNMANSPNQVVGRLEHHSPTTDGSFLICIANGEGVFISKALYDSIPEEHRPALDSTQAGQTVSTLTGETMTTIGTTLIPFFLTDANNGEKFRVILHALVLPDMLINMFISTSASFVKGIQYLVHRDE